MQTGTPIQAVVEEIQRQREMAKDYVVPDLALSMRTQADRTRGVRLSLRGVDRTFEVQGTAHNQLAEKLHIPQAYYQRMLQETPELLAENVNTWLGRAGGRRMVRTLGGDVRAVLSDRYRPIDNWVVAESVLPVLMEHQTLVKSANISPNFLHLQVILPQVKAEVVPGDVVSAGLVLRNSEVGLGSWQIESLVYRLACINGLITSKTMSRRHIGRRIGDSGSDDADDISIYREETVRLDTEALRAKIKDEVVHAIQRAEFELAVERMREAAGVAIPAEKVTKVVEAVAKEYTLTVGEKDGILAALIRSGDLTKWGLVNAITAQAHTTQDYDHSVDFERIGGKVLDAELVSVAVK